MADGTGVVGCPHCGTVGTYKITMQNGGQVVTCVKCHKNMTAEVKQGQFTGRAR